MVPFDPWIWRDPAALAGGYDESTPDRTPPDPSGDDGADRGRGVAEADRGFLDLTGYRVTAADGDIGSVDEASNDTDACYLVVDTGPWIFGHRVLLPAGTVERVDHLSRTVHVDRSRDQIRSAPEYDPQTSRTPEYRDRVARHYAETYRPAG